MHPAGDHHIRLLELLRPAFHLKIRKDGLSDSGFFLLQHMFLTANGKQVDRSSFQALNQQLIDKVNLLLLFLVVPSYPLLDILQEELVPLERVRIMIGQICLLLDFNTKMQLDISLQLYSPHLWQVNFLVLDQRGSFFLSAADAKSVVFLELFFLHDTGGTLAKYWRIFMRLTTIGTTSSAVVCMLKWKKAFDDCFMEY